MCSESLNWHPAPNEVSHHKQSLGCLDATILGRDVSVWSPPKIFMFGLSSLCQARLWEEILSEAQEVLAYPRQVILDRGRHLKEV